MKLLTGKSRKLSLANGEEHKAVFAIVDLDEIKASHNEVNFSDTEGYPKNSFGRNLNDRNYKDDLGAQNNVRKIAEDLNPESLISLSSTPAGTPIINKDGIVVSGNNRVMSLKLAIKDYPENYQAYKKQLAEDIEAFGFDNYIGSALLLDDSIPLPGSSYSNPLSVKFSHPVLVRIDESLPDELTTEHLSMYNQDTKKGERPVDKAIKLSTILAENEKCRNAILNIVDGYDTFSDLYSPAGKNDRKRLIDNFLACGMIPQAQLMNYYENGEFTDAGKDFVEMVLSSMILTPDALKVSSAEGVKRLRTIVISSLPLLITNASLPGASLKDNISNAIIAQYKINQIGDFVDYMRGQSLFADDKIDQNSLILNRLLNQGRNEFKNAIRRYNDAVKANEGNSLFGAADKMSIPEIFEKTITATIAAEDLKLIHKKTAPDVATTSNVGMRAENIQPMLNTTQVEEIVEPIAVPESEVNWFTGDNWFKAHPEKVLGEAYDASGRFGRVTKYKGTIEAIERIDVPMDFIGNERELNNPLLSTAEDVNVSAELFTPETKAFVEDVIKKADKQVGEKIANKKRSSIKIIEEDAIVSDVPQLQTFEDVWRTYNPGISREELQAFVWYKTKEGKPLSRQWINLIHPGEYTDHLARTQHYNVDEETQRMWVLNGTVFYYQGDLIPAPLYLSGNMYDKKMQMDRDRDVIIEKYGPEVFEAQQRYFAEAYQSVYSKRLLISEGDQSLVILPISKFSHEFKVKRIAEIPEDGSFHIAKVTAASDKNYGQPNWKKDIGLGDYNTSRDNFEELSLTDAFVYWLLKFKPTLNQPVTHFEISEHYCYGKPVRIAGEDDSKEAQMIARAKREKLKASTQLEGERLFKIFLSTQLEVNDKIRLETQWNSDFNNYLPVNFNKIPVAFTMCRYYKGTFEELKPEKREAVANVLCNGSGVLAYDVGVGKTPSAIFTMSAFMDAGYAKRPLLVPPNQVYRQFISEIKNFTPHIPIIEGYNLSEHFVENFRGAEGKIEAVPEGVITIVTYEGLERIGFNEETQDRLLMVLYEILNQGGEDERSKSEKQKASFQERVETIIGRGLSGTMFNIEDFGFDFITYDEAHKMKKVFTAVKGEVENDDKGKQSRGKNPYVINSGSPSSIALKGFMLNYYIQHTFNGQNILLLTATPFTNSPLEIFSMLSMVAYEQLRNTDLNNIKTFFDTYVKTSTSLVINSRLKPQLKQVILGFNNLVSLQSLIRRYINYKTGEDVNVQRPKKFVLPYLRKTDDNIVVKLSQEERVETYIGMTALQQVSRDQILDYIETGNFVSNNYDDDSDSGDDNEDEIKDTTSEELDESVMSDDEKIGVRIIKGLTWLRNLALSPHLYKNSGLRRPTWKTYVEDSPKLSYVMGCIQSVKNYHEQKGEEVSGQVIYMDRGIEFFPLLKEYLVKEVGYQEHEIGIIQSGMPKNGKRSKDYVKNLFNGEMYNEETQLFETIPYEQRIKVIIGSSTIKEGINLQKYSTVLYNCFIDWNPTDIQQLYGRVWRQGNTFGSVRLVNPLVIDSADTFLFQKLSEKTSRLNTIWATDGKANVLNLDEFNPEELKYDLIRDPYTIAELQSIEAVAKVDNDIMGYQRDIDTIDKIKEDVKEVEQNFDTALKWIRTYRDISLSGDKLVDARKIVNTTNELFKTMKDKHGKKMVSRWERNITQSWSESDEKFQKRLKEVKQYSDIDAPTKQYWYSSWALAVRDVERAEVQFIKQKDIEGFALDNTAALDSYLLKVNETIANADTIKAHLTSKDYMKELADAVIQKRKDDKIEFKPVSAAVADFGKLNYLLSDRKVKISKAERYGACPPVDKEGNRLIDPDALGYMDECIAAAGQTKDIYFDKETNSYTPARQVIHNEIINELFENVKCVKKGQPIAIFTGGPTAAGKSTYLKKINDYLLTPDMFHLDADAIRAKLPEYQGWNANATHKETQDIVNQLLQNIGSTDCRYDFVYDGTMNKATKYFGLINKVKALGYKTFIIFLDIPYGVARKRALERYRTKGRYVPIEVIDDFFKVIPDHNGLTMGQYALNQLKTMVDGYIVIDGMTGQIISKGGEEMPKVRVYEGQAAKELQNKQLGIPTPIPDAEPIIPVQKVKTKKVKKEEIPAPTHEQNGDDILATIEGLQLLADLGDEDAIATIDALKLLI